MPDGILETQSTGRRRRIKGAGVGSYVFTLVRDGRISPNPDLAVIGITDATPEIVSGHAVTDEQGLPARVRSDHLADMFPGIAVHLLQDHPHTTATGTGRIEIDVIHVGRDRPGRAHWGSPAEPQARSGLGA